MSPEPAETPPLSRPVSTPRRNDQRGRWVAILTGAISVLIGVLYLLLITVLDQRGPLLPPPPEALVGAVVVGPSAVAGGRSPG